MLIQFITGNIVVELTLIDGDDADRQTHTDVCMHATTLKFVQGIPIQVMQWQSWVQSLDKMSQVDQVASIKMWWHLVISHISNTDKHTQTPATQSPPSDQLKALSSNNRLMTMKTMKYHTNICHLSVSQWVWPVMKRWQGDDSDKVVVLGQCQHMRAKSSAAPRLPIPPATTSNTPKIETRMECHSYGPNFFLPSCLVGWLVDPKICWMTGSSFAGWLVRRSVLVDPLAIQY